MEKLTHKAAVVIIPPEDVWETIQAIRQRHDSKVSRWMPHITLLYPFLPRSQFARAEQEVASACSGLEPFDLELARFDQFGHGEGRYSLWLAPEPAEPVLRLHAALCPIVCGDMHDLDRARRRFTPHLSVGQVRGTATMLKLLHELQASWSPIRFRVQSVQLI